MPILRAGHSFSEWGCGAWPGIRVCPHQSPPHGSGDPCRTCGEGPPRRTRTALESCHLAWPCRLQLRTFSKKKGPQGTKLLGPHPLGLGTNGASKGLSHSRKSQPACLSSLVSSRSHLPSFPLPSLLPSLPLSFPFFLSGVKNSWKFPFKKSPSLFLRGRYRLPTAESFWPSSNIEEKHGAPADCPPHLPPLLPVPQVGPRILGLHHRLRELSAPKQFLRAAWVSSHLLQTHLNMFRTSVLPHTPPTAPCEKENGPGNRGLGYREPRESRS